MNWDVFKKRETSFLALIVSLVVLIMSIVGCVQNYQTTYRQLSVAFGEEIGFTFTVLSQSIEFLVPIMLAWGILRSLSIRAQLSFFVVATGVVAWITDAATAYIYFYEAGHTTAAIRVLWAIVGAFLFVTMEIWVMLSLVTAIAALTMLSKQRLPEWVTTPSAEVETPNLEPSATYAFDLAGLVRRFGEFVSQRIMRRQYRPASIPRPVPVPSRSIQPEYLAKLPKS